ncbi:MAG: hypothetical protein R3F53_05860 [Gammaproteobacteria bacterium]
MVGAEDLIYEARSLRRLMLRHPPANNERAIALFLARGHHDSLVRRLNHAFGLRCRTLGDALNRYLPESSRPPTFGGTSYWVHAPLGLDCRRLQREAASPGILIEPGDVFFRPIRHRSIISGWVFCHPRRPYRRGHQAPGGPGAAG